MHSVPLLDELSVVLVLAVLVTVVLSRLRLPTVAGLLSAGALVGPFGLGLARSVHTIETLAEVGVVLLLFSIGLEFSLDRLKDIFRQVALGGIVQVGLTTLVAASVAVGLGERWERGIFYGFAFALSSTAIVLRALSDRRELDAPHGRFIVGTLIFQDLCVVPMVLIVPLLGKAAETGGAGVSIVIALFKAAIVVALVFALSKFLVPRLLNLVDASQSREVFLLAILGICISTAWLTSLAGLSLALGAFLGGMVVADTEFGHRAMGDILPLKDTFVSLFFVSLGMLFDFQVVIERPILVFGLLAGFLLAKGALATLSAMVMRFPSRVAWLAGVGLAQFGEFGFVLTRLAEESEVLSPADSKPLLAAGILSMFLTPLLVGVAPHITAGEKLLAPLEKLIGVRSIDEEDAKREELEDHAVIVGFGLAGQFAAQRLAEEGIPFVALDLSLKNVNRGRDLGLPVYYGDATSEEALRHAHVERAKVVILLMNDKQACERVVDTVRRVSGGATIIARTRYFFERHDLTSLGANEIVVEEVEGAVEIVARLLRAFDAPRNVIDEGVRSIRTSTQPSDRRQTFPRQRAGNLGAFADMKTECARVRQESEAAGRSLIELRLRSRTGALVVRLKEHGGVAGDPDPGKPLQVGDDLYLVGTGEAIALALQLFEGPRHPESDGNAPVPELRES